MITMSEIAKLTGASQATVSRVLNGNTSVNSEVRDRILGCAKEHNYQPNILAKSLVGSKTYLLGVIVTDIANPFFADLVKEIEEHASANGYSLMLFNTNYNIQKQRKYIDLLKSYRVDGMLIVSCEESEEYMNELKNCGIPLVSVTRDLPIIDSVYVSHYDAGAKVANHMLGMGFDSFIYVGGCDDQKEAGFIEELKEKDINIEKQYYFIQIGEKNKVKELLEKRLKQEANSDGIGIFASNDIQAMYVLEYLRELNVKVPQDVALVGFDNTFVCKAVTPTITSIAQPIHEMGRLAVERIINLTDHIDDQEIIRYQLDTRLVVRESTVKIKKNQS